MPRDCSEKGTVVWTWEVEILCQGDCEGSSFLLGVCQNMNNLSGETKNIFVSSL